MNLFCRFFCGMPTFCWQQLISPFRVQPFFQQVEGQQWRITTGVSTRCRGRRGESNTPEEAASYVEILNSEVANPQHLHPDDLHATSVDNNTPRWWNVMTIEGYNSIKPAEAAGESTNKAIPALLGSQRMSNFDKLILAPSPELALTTMYMHSTDMHVATKIPTKWLMIASVEDVQQHRLRTGNQVINMFNRGYMYPQQQIESGCNLRFTTFELASQQTWDISADGGNTMLQQICNYF